MRVLLLDRTSNMYTFGLAEGLRSQGHDVVVAAPADTDRQDAVRVFRQAAKPASKSAQLRNVLNGTARLAWLLLRWKPDVVHIQWPGPLEIACATALPRLVRASILFTAHNPVPRSDERETWVHRQMLEMADGIVVHGPTLKEQFALAHPELLDRTHVIEHGNYEPFVSHFARDDARAALALPTDAFVFAFVGQIRPRKGVELTIEAFARFTDEGGAARLVVAGQAPDPDYLHKLRAIAEETGARLDWQVSKDLVPQIELDRVVSAANLVVLPFLSASQSGSVIYAMTHGRCVVSTAVGEIPRTLSNRGITVDPTVNNLAAAMVRASEDAESCDMLGERAREYAGTELDWRKIASDTLAVYREAGAPRRQRARHA